MLPCRCDSRAEPPPPRAAGVCAALRPLHAERDAAPSAAATFDGDWNVQISSSNAACPSGASVSIGINNGQVASNSATVSASGRVADAGNISVTLASGMKRAVGTGHLSGTWTAQRN